MIKKLIAVQQALKAPKGQTNKFGGYDYRSAEDILNAVKPHLAEQGLALTISDKMVELGGRIYVEATAKLMDGESQELTVSAYAREAETKKGMDVSQITGSASSYARKYALNGLFAIDNTADADTWDNREQQEQSPKKQKPSRPPGYDQPMNLDETPPAGKPTKAQTAEVKRLMSALNLDKKGLAGLYKSKYGHEIGGINEETAADFISYLLDYEQVQIEEQAAAQRG